METFLCLVTKDMFTQYSIYDSPLLRSARRSFAPLQKSHRDNPVLCVNRNPIGYGFGDGANVNLYDVDLASD